MWNKLQLLHIMPFVYIIRFAFVDWSYIKLVNN